MSGNSSDQDALNGPALPQPDGVVPNFDNPSKDNTAGYVLMSVYLALGTLAMLVRVYARIFCTRKVRIEDLLGLAGFICYVIFAWGCYTILDFPGFYVHQWDVRLKDLSRILYPFYITSNAYSDAIGFLKAAILVEWSRIFNPRGIRNTFFWVCHTVLWVNILYYVASAISINLTCFPHQKIWDKTITDGTCINSNALYLSGTIINLLSDLVIFYTPQSVIWGLKLSTSKKVGVSLIFAIGVLCVVVAIVRLVTTAQHLTQTDFVYTLAVQFFVAGSEIFLVLLVFCAPTFPQAVRSLRNKSPLGSGQGDSHQTSGSSWVGTRNAERQTSDYRKIEEHSLVTLATTAPPGSAL